MATSKLPQLTKILLLSTLLGFSVLGWGQNLVPNPSFENVTQCPFSFGLESYTSDWVSGRETPDYFNTCATAPWPMVPNNDFGYQQPSTGNAYIGLLTYRSDSSLYTEAATVQLTNPLTIGQKYYISFRVSLTLETSTGSMVANNKMGIQFSTNAYNPSSPSPINNYAHVWTDSIITDSLNWSVVQNTFIADSNYTHLSLGNFFDKPQVDSIVYGSAFGAYYYFDDICVSTDSTECYTVVGIDESSSNSNFSIFPNPANDYVIINDLNIETPYQISIYNSLGQLLYQEEDILTDKKMINLNEYDNGILFIHIKSPKQNLSYKLIKN